MTGLSSCGEYLNSWGQMPEKIIWCVCFINPSMTLGVKFKLLPRTEGVSLKHSWLYAVPRPAACKKLKVHTMHWGQNWKVYDSLYDIHMWNIYSFSMEFIWHFSSQKFCKWTMLLPWNVGPFVIKSFFHTLIVSEKILLFLLSLAFQGWRLDTQLTHFTKI
jgi:hypothetical protein